MNDIVELTTGPVRGRVFEDFSLFQGIPYAAPPTGELRWRAPQPVQPWTEVRDATKPGNPCPQTASAFANIQSSDEDCLYLDVTAPRTAGTKPVMVWLHGGGGTNGSGSAFDASRLAVDEDVVVVTPNFRLGILGYFAFPGLEDGGCFGLQDQQAVLRWVRDNIAAFGGDPNNVTLFGESYGAFNIGAHLVAPGSAGLFHRAIIQSGFALMRPPANTFMPGQPGLSSMWMPLPELEHVGLQLADQLGWVLPKKGDLLQQLREVEVDELLQMSSVFTRPAFGGQVLPQAPDEALRNGQFHDVPVLLGSNRDEARLFVGLFYEAAGQPVTTERLAHLLEQAFGENAAAVAAEYSADSFDFASLEWAQILTDRAWALSTWELAEALSGRSEAFVYEFADRGAPHILPFPPGFPAGAYHSAELLYQFDLGEPADLGEAQRKLARTMNSYWANFARTGDPNGEGLPEWAPFASGDPHVQQLAPERIERTDFAADHRLEFWREL